MSNDSSIKCKMQALARRDCGTEKDGRRLYNILRRRARGAAGCRDEEGHQPAGPKVSRQTAKRCSRVGYGSDVGVIIEHRTGGSGAR